MLKKILSTFLPSISTKKQGIMFDAQQTQAGLKMLSRVTLDMQSKKPSTNHQNTIPVMSPEESSIENNRLRNQLLYVAGQLQEISLFITRELQGVNAPHQHEATQREDIPYNHKQVDDHNSGNCAPEICPFCRAEALEQARASARALALEKKPAAKSDNPANHDHPAHNMWECRVNALLGEQMSKDEAESVAHLEYLNGVLQERVS